MAFRHAHTVIQSTHGYGDHPPACTLMHPMSHGLARSTCVINCQECCSELADGKIGSAEEQDLRQPRVSSSSRFKTFFSLSLSLTNFLPVLTAGTQKSELTGRGTDRDAKP